MIKTISVFDAGEYVGKLDVDDFDGNRVMVLVKTKLNEKEVDVLNLLDMDYGIIIPGHVAKTIYSLI